MLMLVAYDVNTQSPAGRARLRRVARACLDVGQRVQNSVFECEVEPAQWTALRAQLVGLIDPARDSLLLSARLRWQAARGACRSQDRARSRRSTHLLTHCANQKRPPAPALVRAAPKPLIRQPDCCSASLGETGFPSDQSRFARPCEFALAQQRHMVPQPLHGGAD